MTPRLPIAALALVLLAPAQALAGGPRVAVVEFRTEGEIAPAVREKLAEGLHAGLGAGLTVTPLGESTQALKAANPGLVGCREDACYKEMGRTLGQRVIVQASARSEMEFYHLGLTATEAATGRVLLTTNGDCEICTLMEASKKLQQTAERFSADLGPIVSALPADKPAVAVVTPPVAKPPAPGPAPPPAAKPTPSIIAPKPPPKDLFPEAPPAGDELPPVPGPDPTPPGPGDPPPTQQPPGPSDDFPYGVAAFGALAGGLALLGTGGVLIAKDGDATCDNKPLQRCPTVYDTGQAGLVTVVLGGAGLLTSVVLFLMQQAATGQGPETPPELPKLPR